MGSTTTGPPPEVRIALTRRERRELERVTRKATAPQREVRRARIVLLAARGMGNAETARAVGCAENTVRLWRRRFATERLAGLKDRSRSGRPRRYGERACVAVKAVACQRPEALGLPLGRLSIEDLRGEVAKILDPCPSRSTIQRWLAGDAIRPWRYEMWVTPRDPDFLRKAGPVLDLYAGTWRGRRLGPRDHVLCGDEKTCIQALRRIVPTSPPGPGRPGRVEHEYERKGVLAHQAFLDVRRGKVVGQCVPRNTAAAFRTLVRRVMRRERYRSARRVFLVLDNGSAHLPEPFTAWVRTNYGNAIPVFLPVHGSWLNQAEVYNSILGRKALTPRDVSGRDALSKRISEFERRYNRTAKPFDWTFTRKDLRDLVKRLDPQG